MSRRVAARLVLLPSQFFTLSSIPFLTNSNVPDFPVHFLPLCQTAFSPNEMCRREGVSLQWGMNFRCSAFADYAAFIANGKVARVSGAIG